jgi:hypothetical protein
MTKKLIAVGCSYTADDYTFPVWPELLSKKLNMELVNFGRSGMGNEYIATKVTEASIHLNDIGLVVCMWSEFTRLDFQFNPDWFSIHERDDITEDMKHILLGPYPSTMSSLRQMFLTRSLLRNYSIPYIFIQGTSPYKNNWRVDKEISDYTRGKVLYKERKPKPFREICIRTLIENSYIKFLDEKNFLGWPIFYEIGGWCVDDKLEKDERISKFDNHPNANGHQHIAELLYNFYERDR